MLNLRFQKNVIFFVFMLLAYCLNLSGEFYTPNRLGYPALCKDHFNNDIATKMTWLESGGEHFINPLVDYLKYIPKPYGKRQMKPANKLIKLDLVSIDQEGARGALENCETLVDA